MPVYIIPPSGTATELLEKCQRAGVPVLTPSTTREFILQTAEHPHAVAAVGPQILLILSRHANELLVDLPSMVMAVPGIIYEPAWVTMAAAFPIVDAHELEAKLAKSGVVSSDVNQLTARNRGVPVGDTDVVLGNQFQDADPGPRQSAGGVRRVGGSSAASSATGHRQAEPDLVGDEDLFDGAD